MNITYTQCPASADDAFGPVINCPNRFDFTLRFEQSFLSIPPSALLLIAATLRLWTLRHARKRIDGWILKYIKLVTFAILSILDLVLVVLWASQYEMGPSLAAAILSFVTCLVSCALSILEHSRSLQPSVVLNGYLLLSLLLDSAILRSLWLSTYHPAIRNVFTASFACKGLLLILEAKEKRSFLIHDADEKKSHEETAGLYSQWTFWWLNSMIQKGYRQVMISEDLCPVNEDMSSEILGERFWRAWNSSTHQGKYRLILVAIRTFQKSILWTILPRLVLIAFTICQPLLVTRFLSYLQDENEKESTGWALVGAYAVVYLGMAISTGSYWYRNYKTLTMLRGSLVTAVFRKTTEISITALDNSAAVTLMSTDVDRVVRGLQQFHELWANVLQIGIATYLLEMQIGLACLAPIAVAIFTTIVMTHLSGKIGARQKKWIKENHQRVGITTTTIGSMKGIKMSGLSETLFEQIKDLRVEEIHAAKSFRLLEVLGSTLAYVPLMASPVLAFAIFVAISIHEGQTLDVNRLFTALSILLLLTQPLFTTFAGFMELISAIGCFDRIQMFLAAESRSDHRIFFDSAEQQLHSSLACPHETIDGIELITHRPDDSGIQNVASNEAISIRDWAFSWTAITNEPILHDINLTIPMSKLTLLIGPVASGKSTLLKSILGERPSSKGFVYISTKEIAWCEQSPWIINASVQRNILGFSPLEPEFYSSVVEACDLNSDIALFPNGDQTIVGSKGITLSGGQKQRIAIARAVYARKRIAIFDDVFSGLDQQTERHVFHKVFGPDGLLRKWNTTVIIATHAVNLLLYSDHIIALGASGTIVEQGTFADLSGAGGYVQSSCLKHLDDTEQKAFPVTEASKEDESSPTKVTPINMTLPKDRQTGDISIYRYYFKSVGAPVTAAFFSCAACWGFFNAFPTIWLKWWADSNEAQPNANTAYYIGIYALLQSLGLSTNAALVWFSFNVMVARAGLYLHDSMLKTAMRAPMAFFSSTDIGSIVTRFSQDLQLIDGPLPLALMCVVSYSGVVLAQMTLIASSSPYIAISFPALLAAFYFLQRYFLRTSRQLRLLDLEEKAPIFSQFIESLSGLTTIRSFAWSAPSIAQNHELLDRAQRPYYLLYMIQRWLTFVLDIITTCIAIIVVSVAVKTKGNVSIGFTGVSLTQLISFTSILKATISFWGQLETSIGAVARVRQFERETDIEDLASENTQPGLEWPEFGKIEFQNLSASYTSNPAQKALDNITFTISPGQKVGICGRTGSGKSSLVLALFRMIESTSGRILLDDLDTSLLPRQAVRFSVNGLSQDPFFLHGTTRLNLDPTGSSNDDIVTSALQKVGLWDVISSKGGLDGAFDPDMLSHGQRQLFCLARAIIRKDRGRIVVLDEVTSSIDRQTDALMQKLIRDEFRTHTIIAVAHRLETIVDFDTVLVLDAGRVVEMGAPSELVQKSGSRFGELWRSSGNRGGV